MSAPAPSSAATMTSAARADRPALDLSVVIPVYGCRAALPELHRRLVQTIEGMGLAFEVVLVDDCCPQNSWEEIQAICAVDKRVVGLHLSRNFGQIRAITAGLDACRGSWVVVMDCDLQDRPEAIPQLWNKAQEGWDVVFVQRVARKDSGVTKFLSRAFYKAYEWFTDGSYDPTLCNFSIASRQVIDSYCTMREHNRGYTTFIKWLGYRQTAIGIEGDERFEGESSYTLRRKLRMAFELITSQSTKPLKLAVSIGFFIALLAFVYLAVLVVRKLVDPTITVGWTSTVGAIFLMGGLNMSFVGVVGLYVGNIFDEVKDRPLYVVAVTLNGEDGDGR